MPARIISSSSIRAAAIAVAAIVLAPACAAPGPQAPESAQAQHQGSVDRGRYLVSILACNDCHTPWVMGPEGPMPDMTRMLSGHPQDLVMPDPPALPEGPWLWLGAATNTAYAGPWGVSYAPNITPSESSGIGIWTREIFVKALRTGKHWGESRPILPPMPWPAYARMTDEDLGAIYDYLRTIPPLENRVPDTRPAPGHGPSGGS